MNTTPLSAHRLRTLAVVAVLIVLIAVADRSTGTLVSLGVLYVLPMILGAVVLTPVQIVLLALLCTSLRTAFDFPYVPLERITRSLFALISYSACGLIVAELIHARRVSEEHIVRIGREHALRREAEEQLKTLVESSPAAILTVGGDGTVLAANNAASQLFGLPGGESLRGRSIAGYLPVLSDALAMEKGGQCGSIGLRTAAQCPGHRDNGEIFLANTWFSSYVAQDGNRLAAIVVDSSEEMREQEEEALRQLMRGNQIAASAVSHEVRNLCGAISVVCLNLGEKRGLRQDEEFQALESMVHGLGKIASYDLASRRTQSGGEDCSEQVRDIALRLVLDDLRIVIEPDWREIDGAVFWRLPAVVPKILADRHGLLQVFLNLAQNSHRAVRNVPVRELHISLETDGDRVLVRFCDSGPGIAAPGHLFEPFQPGANGSGLGLYVSRAMVRGYGGELRYEPRQQGSCFTVELQAAPPEDHTSAARKTTIKVPGNKEKSRTW